jgi:hypothetical protein
LNRLANIQSLSKENWITQISAWTSSGARFYDCRTWIDGQLLATRTNARKTKGEQKLPAVLPAVGLAYNDYQ